MTLMLKNHWERPSHQSTGSSDHSTIFAAAPPRTLVEVSSSHLTSRWSPPEAATASCCPWGASASWALAGQTWSCSPGSSGRASAPRACQPAGEGVIWTGPAPGAMKVQHPLFNLSILSLIKNNYWAYLLWDALRLSPGQSRTHSSCWFC